MKKKLVIFFLSCICQLWGQNTFQYKPISNKIKDYYKIGEKDSVYKYLNEYLAISKKNNDSLYIGKSYFKKGIYYDKFNIKDSSYFFYKKSILYFSKLNDSVRVSKSLINISFILNSLENYSDSDSTAVKALRYLKKTKYKDLIYNCLAMNSRGRYNYKDAIKYYKEAIKLSNNKKNLIKYYGNMANSYGYINDHVNAVYIYQNLLDTTNFSNIKRTKARVIDNLARIKWESRNKKMNDDILKDFIRAEQIRKREKDNEGLISSYKNLSNYFFSFDKKRAFEYAKKMFRYANKTNNSINRLEALEKLILYPSINQEEYFNQIKKIRDSSKKYKGQKKIRFAKIEYDVEEEKRKKLIVESNLFKARADYSEQKLNLEKQKSQKLQWLFIGLTSFLGFITYFFYKREKTKKEKIIEVYNTETRLAKKIHDVLANDMYLVMNKLQKEEREDTSILYDLEKIYSLTRNISHESSPVITGYLFEGFLKQLFTDFTTDTCKILNKGLSDIHINSLRKEKQIVLYRLLQELLVNMKKHSQASLVIITFSIIKDTIQVEYKDNGIGVDTLGIKSGLQNMETRIKSIKGTIIFELETHKGFQVKFHFKR